jgi:hypothetical protein
LTLFVCDRCGHQYSAVGYLTTIEIPPKSPDARQALTKEEVALKLAAIVAMHKHQKTVYAHGGVEIRLVTGEEAISVKNSEARRRESRSHD